MLTNAGELAVVEDRPEKRRSLTCVPFRYGSFATITSPGSSRSTPYSSTVFRTESAIVPGEEHDAVAHRRRRPARVRRAGDRRGEVVEVAQDRRERGGQEPRAHVLDDVAEAVREHGRGEAVAAVAGGELGVAEVADRGSRVACSITISPRRPTSAVWPGQTNVVERPSRMIAGPSMRAPDGQRVALVLAGLRAARSREVAQLERPGRLDRARRRARAAAYSTFSDGHDAADAVGDALHRHEREAVAVAPLVLLVEALDHLGDRRRRDRPVGHLDERRLPALAEEPAVEAAPHLARPAPARSRRPRSISSKTAAICGAASGDEQDVGAAAARSRRGRC